MLKNVENMEIMTGKELEQDYKNYDDCEYKELDLSKEEYFRNEKIVYDILKFLKEYCMLEDEIIIFYNEKKLDLAKKDFRQFDYDCYGSYCCGGYSNDKTVTMVFEGDFYEMINGFKNGTEWVEMADEFHKLVDKYNLFYEIGNAYNLSLYE